uniref:Uncharacterized protein n=1 Tax=Otolemur garnettii TaxID=30611 RepID=H0XRN7_OTOGA
ISERTIQKFVAPSPNSGIQTNKTSSRVKREMINWENKRAFRKIGDLQKKIDAG